MSEYSAEVQHILDAKVGDPNNYGAVASDVVWDHAIGESDERCKFYDRVAQGYRVVNWDAATAVQFRSEISPEDYEALMAPWRKATGLRELDKKDHPAFATGGYVGPTKGILATGEKIIKGPWKEATVRRSTLTEAANLIDGDRNVDYGEPIDNFNRISALWSVLFQREVTNSEVALAMALVKVARLVHQPDHHDSYVDAAGYLAIGDELRDQKV